MSAGSPQPEYSLAEAKSLIKLAIIGDRVLKRAALDCPHDELPKVDQFVRKLFLSLDENAFAHSKLQTYPDNKRSIMADVYAIKKSGSWYIKFYIEHGRVTVLSCHCPEHDVKLANGKTVKAPT
jgi:hypothetical protein